jgi:hypothetical protein
VRPERIVLPRDAGELFVVERHVTHCRFLGHSTAPLVQTRPCTTRNHHHYHHCPRVFVAVSSLIEIQHGFRDRRAREESTSHFVSRQKKAMTLLPHYGRCKVGIAIGKGMARLVHEYVQPERLLLLNVRVLDTIAQGGKRGPLASSGAGSGSGWWW